ncbi:MAG: selenide, water dikinase SelD [Bacteroidales bacterium]
MHATVSNNKRYNLTEFTHGMGCACKMRPQELEKILAKIPIHNDPNILIDTKNSDDAAVYKISSETAIVQTLDFFTPIVDDAYTFGTIAATNALSDIYAMGAKPIFGLNIVGFPSSRLPAHILEDILRGASDVAEKAGISIIGGHTIEDIEPKYGLAVTGIVHPDKILSNGNAREGDILILTKPIGTGILSTAVKRGLVKENTINELNKVMTTLNNVAGDIIKKYPVSACTDVTGFGLLGHLSEMVKASDTGAEIYANKVPLIQETQEFAGANTIPGGTYDNMAYLKDTLLWEEDIPEFKKLILCDAQTSGGLLIALPEKYKDTILNQFQHNGIEKATFIGKFIKKGEQKIRIKNL